MYCDPEGTSVILIVFITLAIIAIEAFIGQVEYQIYGKHDENVDDANKKWIQISPKGDVKIKNSYFIRNTISQLIFLINIRSSDDYKSKFHDNNNQRNIFDMLLEWKIHNVAAMLTLPFHIINRMGITNSFFDQLDSGFVSSYSVDMENSKEWFNEIWEKIKRLFS